MTQAVNLANFANNLDSSGGVSPSALNSAVPVAKGGTGSTTVAGARTNLDVPTRTGTDASGTWNIGINGNAATSTLATKASTLAQSGGNGSAMTFNWQGQAGQPTWLWGGNDGISMFVYNPANFNVTYANSSGSAATDSQHLGVGQTWQNVSGSRVAGTTYTNNTGKPIMVNIYFAGSNSAIYAIVNGVSFCIASNGGYSMAGSVLIPTSATYSVGAFTTWHELR